MNEAFVPMTGSGERVYTESDCAFVSSTGVLTFPSGVTWGKIKKALFCCDIIGEFMGFYSTNVTFTKDITDGKLKFYGYGSTGDAYSPLPDDSDVQIVLRYHVGDMSTSLRSLIIIT